MNCLSIIRIVVQNYGKVVLRTGLDDGRMLYGISAGK